MQLKDTLNLPRTDFPMRGNLTAREPARLAHWEKIGLYRRLQEKNATRPAFVLHDGPPFTNGDVHIGTALNKLLKDTVLRFQSARGHRTPYVPGWDCHGLPIEHKVSKELRDQKRTLTPAELRAECAAFSARYIEKQRAQFQRLGVLADWVHEYKTMAPAYEAAELRAFAHFVEHGLVYRSKKPVYWSIPCETALAEAEIEYKDHVSPSIYVKFPVPNAEIERFNKLHGLNLPTDKPLSVVIWTTTPWTLPANLAIAVHPNEEYQVIDLENEYIISAQKLAAKLPDAIRNKPIDPLEVVKGDKTPGFRTRTATAGTLVKGSALEGLQPRHPFIDRASPIVLADYVTMDTGTGCVHTAPGHGLEDYQTGLKYKLPIYCPLDDKGCYIPNSKIPSGEYPEGDMPPELVGVTVLEGKPGKCPANDKVLEILTARGALLANTPYQHQYPHCWRSKTPVVFRAMDQWFIGLDRPLSGKHHGPAAASQTNTETLRQKALAAIGQVKWIPAAGENRIGGAIASRPDWCISRQRAWGVPIPAFFGPHGHAYLEPSVIRALADKFEQHGSSLWFEQDAEQLLAGIHQAQHWPRPLKKSADTLDVWLDSGCSHFAVLKRPELHLAWPADLYLEGSDQHRGWFQSSLWTALATDGAPPYKAVLTHGFVVDENGRKLSKSDGKPQTADDYVKKYGADLIRLWIASEDFRADITLSENIFQHITNTYRSLRNTLMYQLGNLAGFDPPHDAVAPGQLTPLDQWVLHRLHHLVTEVTAAFDAYDFHLGVKAIDQFVSVTLSRQYHDILKDRLYTFAPDSPERRSAQTAIHAVLRALLGLLAPVLPFTADEAWSHLAANSDFTDDSIHLQSWPTPDPAWITADFQQTAADIDALHKFRERINEKLELLRQEKKIGKSVDAVVTLAGDEEPMPLLERHHAILEELFIVSRVTLLRQPGPLEITVAPAADSGFLRCPRSWRWVPELVAVDGFEEKVSPRDRDALLAKFAPQKT
ncbi:MAG: isoleucine--tRNA ligase [Opitutales bacterium]